MMNPAEASFNCAEWPRCMTRLRFMNSFAISAVAFKTLLLLPQLPSDLQVKQDVVGNDQRGDYAEAIECRDNLRIASPRRSRTERSFRGHRPTKHETKGR